MNGTVLVVDDDMTLCSGLRRSLTRGGHEVEVANSGSEALDKLSDGRFDVVLMDVHMPGQDGIETLGAMRERGHEQPVVIMSGQGSVEMAVRAVRRGALDFIEKPLRPSRVSVTVENALRYAKLSYENNSLRSRVHEMDELIGESRLMTELKAMIDRVSRSEGRVLITGENGTGKELVARALHQGSSRADGPFVKLNCAAIPSELIESELFGHEKGAFTGAVASRAGKFELAHRGTLLLDEVGDMPAIMQAKLLRVLQEGELERVGSTRSRSVDARVIAATNRDLRAMVANGEFREDLYYRLNVVALHVPPLRDREGDVRLLAPAFLAAAAKKNGRRPQKIDDAALDVLSRHSFPGNVRELENLVERLVILADDQTLTAESVAAALPTADAPARKASYREGASLKELIAESEKAIIEDAIKAHGGSMTETSAALGMERSHLYKKVKLHAIKRPGS
jgi:DNA-binding NtrC family response regulator